MYQAYIHNFENRSQKVIQDGQKSILICPRIGEKNSQHWWVVDEIKLARATKTLFSCGTR